MNPLQESTLLQSPQITGDLQGLKKALVRAFPFASKGSICPQVQIRHNTVMATNGHILTEIKGQWSLSGTVTLNKEEAAQCASNIPKTPASAISFILSGNTLTPINYQQVIPSLDDNPTEVTFKTKTVIQFLSEVEKEVTAWKKANNIKLKTFREHYFTYVDILPDSNKLVAGVDVKIPIEGMTLKMPCLTLNLDITHTKTSASIRLNPGYLKLLLKSKFDCLHLPTMGEAKEGFTLKPLLATDKEGNKAVLMPIRSR